MKNLKKLLLFCLLVFVSLTNAQQKFFTKKGKINFYSKAPLEDITANNEKVLSIIDISTGEMAIQIVMKDFQFKKALMQEHFNENYVESDKYPNATFKGKIVDFDTVNENKTQFTVKGTLTIHGVSKETEIIANFKRTNENIEVDGDFIVALKDFKIKIPKIVFMNIAENIKVTFNFNHQPYNK